jgi:hypothetical protein
MQSRELRVKNVLYLIGYMSWFSGCVLFLMYRLKSDDLETLEKEAEDRIRINSSIKKAMKETYTKQ